MMMLDRRADQLPRLPLSSVKKMMMKLLIDALDGVMMAFLMALMAEMLTF